MKKTETNNYRAPALEKGLDIIELLSEVDEPLSAAQIAEHLDRSKAELYRMLQVLESRGYVERRTEGEGFFLTRKLLLLGTDRQPLKDLLEFSAPLMRQFATQTQQAIHIAVQSMEQMVVIARVAAPGAISYSVRTGYRRPLVQTASGKVIYAFQTQSIQETWINMIKPTVTTEQLNNFLSATRKISKQGYERSASHFVKGVTDLSAPIIDSDHAIAALTVPFIEHMPVVMSIEDTLNELRSSAEEISSALKFGYVAPL